jgi:hypothetical protein
MSRLGSSTRETNRTLTGWMARRLMPEDTSSAAVDGLAEAAIGAGVGAVQVDAVRAEARAEAIHSAKAKTRTQSPGLFVVREIEVELPDRWR